MENTFTLDLILNFRPTKRREILMPIFYWKKWKPHLCSQKLYCDPAWFCLGFSGEYAVLVMSRRVQQMMLF